MEKLKVGIIGLGSWGLCHLEAYRSLPFVEVTAVCEADPQKRQKAAELGIANVYETFEQLLRHEDIVLVSIVTYEQMHLAPTLAALEAGKHVLVEKPVATDVLEAERMLEKAREWGRYVIPGHLLRFEPKYAEVERMISSGAIGRPASIYMKRSRQNSLFHTYKRTHTVYELMIHDLDQAIWYAGSRVRKVYATGCFLSGGHSPDILWAQLQFENGVVAVLQSNWMTHDASGIAINDYTEVVGDKGTAHFDTHAAGVQLWGTEGRHTTDLSVHHIRRGRATGALKEQLEAVCLALLEHKQPEAVSFEDAVHGIRVADAIVESARTGQEIVLRA